VELIRPRLLLSRGAACPVGGTDDLLEAAAQFFDDHRLRFDLFFPSGRRRSLWGKYSDEADTNTDY
jgi:hypothetical protein